MLNCIKRYIEWDLRTFMKLDEKYFRKYKDCFIMNLIVLPGMLGARLDMCLLNWIDTKRGLN